MGKIKRIPNDEIPFINYLKNNLKLIFVFFETSTFLNYMRGSNSSFFQYFFYFYLRKLSFQIANMFIRLFLPEFRLVFRPVVLYLNIYTIHLIINASSVTIECKHITCTCWCDVIHLTNSFCCTLHSMLI